MIKQDLEREGKVLSIKSEVQNDQLDVYWNGDTPQYSKQVAPNEEVFIYMNSIRDYKNHTSSIAISIYEAGVLAETLLHMVKRYKEIE